MHYFIGLLFIAAGSGMILKTEWLIQNLGSNAWAEQHIGSSGGSRILYKFIGLVLIFLGFLLVTNLMNDFLMATIGKMLIR